MPVSSVNIINPTIVKKVVVGVPISTAVPPTATDSDLAALAIQVNLLQQQVDSNESTLIALPNFTIATLPPSSPSIGDIWIDISI